MVKWIEFSSIVVFFFYIYLYFILLLSAFSNIAFFFCFFAYFFFLCFPALYSYFIVHSQTFGDIYVECTSRVNDLHLKYLGSRNRQSFGPRFM